MAAGEEGPEPLRYQTLALKVSIHCEGCKKKVKKVLHSIEGVYKTDIDMQQQKVVVIGNVSADALVKKLLKTGKHAEPWPELAPPGAEGPPGGAPGSGGKKKKKKSKSKNPANNKPAEPAPAPAEGGSGGGPSPPEKHDHAGSCDEESDGEHDKPEGGVAGGGNGSPDAGDAHDGGADKVVPFAMTPHGTQPIAPAANGSGGGGGGAKKKGKKGGNGNGNANANGDGAGEIVEVQTPDAPMKPVAGNAGPLAVVDAGPYPPPPAALMSYPGYHAAGGHSPAYVMSYYSTAHPSSALRSSAYYHPMVGASYTAGGGGGYFYSTAPVSAAPGSYYMFSEENANACSVM
ncbi:heavy metal-associated isoprenylated plant protein 35-like [Phragmites australis]|uniref:heavy metal-associated isoprenylated plant protein 35-like n=1 Tax=Phragmites australis TaxID=29695 RepID=UPI002D787357|nr:heavy metal-associated isoprenylated plant protein 35-like [Phragmites australis]